MVFDWLDSFATLTHTRGNFILMPVYNDPATGRPTNNTNLNLVRNRMKSDYWDLTLAGIKAGQFSEFFRAGYVAPQFVHSEMPGGFDGYIEGNHLEAYIGADGEVAPRWNGHLEPGTKTLPQKEEHVLHFLHNVCEAIERRSRAIKHCGICSEDRTGSLFG